MTDITARVDALLVEYYGEENASEIQADEKIWQSGGTGKASPGPALICGDRDSLDKIEFMMAVEDAFDLRIDDVIAEMLNTKADLIKYLEAMAPSTDAN